MKDTQNMITKLVISIFVPLLIVTFGGLIVYQTFSAFFYTTGVQETAGVNGPAIIYYALTFVVALMYFLLRQGYKGYDIIALGLMSIVYSLSMQKLTPGIHRPVYLYIVPQLVLFLMISLILRYIFLNKMFRSVRLIAFSVLSAAAFTITFWLQYVLLRQITDSNFLQTKFIQGLMLFIFIGFGLSVAEFILLRIDVGNMKKNLEEMDQTVTGKSEEHDETD